MVFGARKGLSNRKYKIAIGMLVIAADDSTARSWRGWREKMWFQSKLKREQVTSSYLLASLSPGAVPMRPPILVIKITNFVRSHLTSSFGLVLLCTLISSFVAANPITTSPTWSHLHFLLCFWPALALKPALVSRHTTGSRSGVQSF